MTEVQDDRKYTQDHEWVKKDDGKVKYGITDYAQDELGDIVYVEAPHTDDEVDKGDAIGVLESVKTVSDLHAPVSGTIVEVNDDIEASPELLNDDPYGEGWIAVIETDDESEFEDLMSAEEYKEEI